ncbi:hypothetical protein [Stenotrophomonas sp.]|uniref:hypothetical protein n=1 Tax=Stenotrophomonas sp. TaxID=69392 RepID=UPI0028A9A46D|nr:hypothetical protein [Stenotrophomonas sp.]
MATARQQWKAFYRAARAAYRLFLAFQSRFKRQFSDGVPDFLYTATKKGPLRFEFCRLHGDFLRVFNGMWAHDCRMAHFRRRVRLPGTRIGGAA